MDLRPLPELNNPGSPDEQAIPKKPVRKSQPLYTPVPSNIRKISRCSTPRNADQDEYIQCMSAAIRQKSPSEVYKSKGPCVSVVIQVNDNVHVSSESSDDDAMMAMKDDNNGHQPEAINPTGEIIKAMIQDGNFRVISRVVRDMTGTHHLVP